MTLTPLRPHHGIKSNKKLMPLPADYVLPPYGKALVPPMETIAPSPKLKPFPECWSLDN
jgi:hypothetical protein